MELQFHLPSYMIGKNWKGMFPGNYTGNVWQTRNVDLERTNGRVSLSDKMRIHVDSSTLTNLGVVTKFIRTNADTTDQFWALSDQGRMFKDAATSPIATYAQDALSNSPTDALDMETHEQANGEQRLIVTRATDIAILNGPTPNAWTASWWQSTLGKAALTSNPHPIARVQRLLGIGDGNLFHTIDKDDVVSLSRLIFPYGFITQNVYASSNRFWIGLKNNMGGKARVIEWDGTSLAYNNEYDLDGSIPLTGFLVNSNPYFITESGYIMEYTGGGFEPIAQFPNVEDGIPFDSTSIKTYGCAVDRSIVYILVNHPNLDIVTSRKFISGIWIFNTKTRNLYHHRGLGMHSAAGTEPDFGQSPLSAVGGLHFTIASNTSLLIAGATVYTNYTGGTRNAIFTRTLNRRRYQSAGYNRGYFVTTYVPIAEVEAMWEGVWMKFRRFVDSTNRIVIKGRVVDPKVLALGDLGSTTSETAVQATGTWTATTTFTCVVPTGVVVGEEVEVMSGNGAGCTFHILTLSATPDNSTTITVTVDEALPSLNAGGSRGALFRFDNWAKLGTISSTTVGNQKLVMPSAQHGEFVQFKVELRGYEVEVDELQPVLKVKTQVTNA